MTKGSCTYSSGGGNAIGGGSGGAGGSSVAIAITMIERVARVLAEQAMEPYDDISRKKYDGDARAAIAAMREPTAPMIFATYPDEGPDNRLAAKYRKMIDAALAENPRPYIPTGHTGFPARGSGGR